MRKCREKVGAVGVSNISPIMNRSSQNGKTSERRRRRSQPIVILTDRLLPLHCPCWLFWLELATSCLDSKTSEQMRSLTWETRFISKGGPSHYLTLILPSSRFQPHFQKTPAARSVCPGHRGPCGLCRAEPYGASTIHQSSLFRPHQVWFGPQDRSML